MGVFSEMDMEQYENGGTEPFQLDSYMVPATELSGRPDPPKQSPMNTPTPPAKVTAENKNGDVPTADPGKDMEAPKKRDVSHRPKCSTGRGGECRAKRDPVDC